MLVVNKNPAAEPTVQGVFHYFKECCWEWIRTKAAEERQKGGENRECLNCRLTVDIFDRAGEEQARNY